jgi:hypothetical protein
MVVPSVPSCGPSALPPFKSSVVPVQDILSKESQDYTHTHLVQEIDLVDNLED